jgi:geranylgeranyl diphosphate synthase type I
MTNKRLLRSARNDERQQDQTIVLVDDRDKFKGYTTWREGHHGKGKRHRGFVVLLFDEAGNVYLQKRKHRVFDGLWDLTAISHPYRLGGKGDEGDKGSRGRDESLDEAALRSLKNEMGIACLAEDGESRRGKIELTDVGAFVYFAKDGEWCENEYCHVLVGKFDGKFKPNKKFVYEARKMAFEEFVEDVNQGGKKYTPWARETVKLVGKMGIVGELRGKEFEEDLERFRKEFGRYAKEYFAKKSKLVKKYPGLIARFYKELEEFGQGGKLLRPYLLWIGYRVSQSRKGKVRDSIASLQNDKMILPVCMAYELVHSFFLIHDDIIDRSDTRRDKLTVHKKFEKVNGPHFGISMGILAGDLALVEAWGEIAELRRTLRGTTQAELLFDKFIEVIRDTIFGEALDVEYSYKKASIDQIWQVIDLKTARYSFVGPLMLGMALGSGKGDLGGKGSRGTSLQKFGMLVGRAYQLKDDLLAVFGDEKVTGKSGLSDMREGKNTVLLYKALEMSGQQDRQFISRYWGNEKSGVKELVQIKNIFEKSGALVWCQKRLEKLVGDASSEVEKITKDKKLQQILDQLAQMVAARDK